MTRRAPRVGRRLGAFLAVAAMVVVGAFLGAAPALAHNVLVSSDPADGATLETAPEKVTFTFDQAIEDFDPTLKVFGPDGNDFTTGAPTILGNSISAPLAAGPAGEYRAAYRIVSADGHPVTGQITFTLTKGAAGAATGQPANSPNSSSAASSGSPSADADAPASTAANGLGAWLWVIIGAAAVLVIVAIALALRKPRDQQ